MNALDKLVIQKRLDCDEDCTFAVKQKKYRQQRKNLGELMALARSKPRPVIQFEKANDVSEPEISTSSTQSQATVEEYDEEISTPGWNRLFETPGNKRLFEQDSIGYLKRQQTDNEEMNRREQSELYERWKSTFGRDIQAYNDAIEGHRNRETIRASLKEYSDLARATPTSSSVREALSEYREGRIREMENEIEAYEAYRENATNNNNNSVIRTSLDEWYAHLRENVGELEQLR